MSSSCSEDDNAKDSISLDEAKLLLRSPDFVLDPKVERAVDVFVKSRNGSVCAAVDLLANNYRGDAELCKVMMKWLVDLGYETASSSVPIVNDEEFVKEETKKVKKGKKSRGRVKKKEEPESPEKRSSEAVVKAVEDVLRVMLVKHFSSMNADHILDEAGIDWLPQLIAFESWRHVVYELLEKFPGSIFLNFTVRLISDAGYKGEIAKVNIASRQLEIFTGVFLSAVDSLLTEHKDGVHSEKYDAALSHAGDVACRAEHTYIYASALLEVAGRSDPSLAAACAHTMQSLRNLLQRGKEYDATALRCSMLCQHSDPSSIAVIEALLSIMHKTELNPADITQIYKYYSQPEPPPVEIIQDSLFIDLLVDSLFHCNGPKMNADYREKYVYLLAYTAAVSEYSAGDGVRHQSKLEFDVTKSAIERTISCIDSADEAYSELQTLLRDMQTPVIAVGLLHYAKTFLLTEIKSNEPLQFAYVIIDTAASLHANLRIPVFSYLCKLYEKFSWDTDIAEVIIERQRLLLDRFVHLLSVGFVLPVVEKIVALFRDGDIDASLVRYFLTEALEMMDPPFSKSLCTLVLPLLCDDEIFDRSTREKIPSVIQFTQYCQEKFKIRSHCPKP